MRGRTLSEYDCSSMLTFNTWHGKGVDCTTRSSVDRRKASECTSPGALCLKNWFRPRKTRRIACSTQCTLLLSHNRPTIYSGRSVWLTNHRKGFRASPGWAGTIAQARGPAGRALPVPRQGGLTPQIADHTYMGQYGSMLSEEDLQIAA